MHLTKKLETVGEVEVLEHILAASKKPKEYIVVDARTEQWYKQMTIPTAINLPFNQLQYDEDLEEDDFDTPSAYQTYQANYKHLFKLLNIKESKKGLDFSEAKNALLFCNGSWCSQSPKAIRSLINIGYPIEKLRWYRGGLQDWLIYDFTVEKSLN
jgi:rhodanese-related sulfurtransferase